MPDDLCPGCNLPTQSCDCATLANEAVRARWEEDYHHSLTLCAGGCDGWFPESALVLGHCAYCAAQLAKPLRPS